MTYWVAPLINEKFEIQSAKREFLVKNLENFSSDTRKLIDTIFNSMSENRQDIYNLSVQAASPAFTKLQFSATQMAYIIPDQSSLIVDFQRKLDVLQDDLISYKVGTDNSKLVAQTKELTKSSLAIYDALLQKAGLGGMSKVNSAK